MTKAKQPTLIIFAGANGSGKTTVAKLLLPKRRIKEFVNADEIARGLSPLNPTGQAVAAGRLVLKRTKELIAKRESFAIETTLSGNTLLQNIVLAQKAGYAVEMHYIFCADINVNIQRVKTRVKQGGHDVPAFDIRRRYWRSLRNYVRVFHEKCDKIAVYDTTAGALVEIADKDHRAHYVVFDDVLFQRFVVRLNEALDDER